MSIVSAFIEQTTGAATLTGQNYRHGIVNGKNSSGLDVDWLGSEPPTDAQVHVQWLPVAIAVWADPPAEEPVVEYAPVIEEPNQEESNGSEPPAEDAGVVGPGVEESTTEVDSGTGQPGESLGEGSEPGSEEPAPVE